METVKTPLESYLDRATELIEKLDKTGNMENLYMADILRMGRGVMTQQDAEIRHLKNELSVKTETIKAMLSRRKEPV